MNVEVLGWEIRIHLGDRGSALGSLDGGAVTISSTGRTEKFIDRSCSRGQ